MAHHLRDIRRSPPLPMLTKLRSFQLNLGDLLLLVVISISLIPIWVVPFFPTQDGPSHVENAEILLNYWSLNRPEIRELSKKYPTSISS